MRKGGELRVGKGGCYGLVRVMGVKRVRAMGGKGGELRVGKGEELWV